MSATIITVAKEVYGLFYGCYKVGRLFNLGSTGFIEVGEKFTVIKAIFGKEEFIEIKHCKIEERIDAPFIFHLSYTEFKKAFPGVELDDKAFIYDKAENI